jgi:hypothetical protein
MTIRSIDEIPIPALLRAARGSYIRAIRTELGAAGFSDLPRNGAYVLGGMLYHGEEVRDLVRGMGIGREAAVNLLRSLVALGYLDRDQDPDEPDHVDFSVTERVRAAAVKAGVATVDAELDARLSVIDLAGLRAGLLVLCEIREQLESETAAHSDGDNHSEQGASAEHG